MLRFLIALVAASAAIGPGPRDSAEVMRATDESYIQLLVSGQDYRKLEAFAVDTIAKRPIDPAGVYTRALIYDDVYNATAFHQIKGPDCRSPAEDMLKRWRRDMPASSLAVLAGAKYRVQRAFCFRGTGWASTVTPEGGDKFDALIEEARQDLEAHADISRRDPEWYVLMESIATYQSWPKDRFLALVDEGSARFPAYFLIANRGMMFFSSRWSGSDKEMEAYARRMAAKSAPFTGDQAYARMYAFVDGVFGSGYAKTDSPIDWPRMRASMAQIVERYPDRLNGRLFAQLACKRPDLPLFVHYARLGKLGTEDGLKAVRTQAQCMAYFRS